ncbi:hypothetical protein GOODEAATRI_008301 [Goodea atripinnis]|uniref:Uncharacterized protein n=1 Tax=Goodea atripinnis TaxID=208336 RepID=A0ABV0PWS8_9TELE
MITLTGTFFELFMGSKANLKPQIFQQIFLKKKRGRLLVLAAGTEPGLQVAGYKTISLPVKVFVSAVKYGSAEKFLLTSTRSGGSISCCTSRRPIQALVEKCKTGAIILVQLLLYGFQSCCKRGAGLIQSLLDLFCVTRRLGGLWVGEEAKATLWTTLMVNVGEDRPPEENGNKNS